MKRPSRWARSRLPAGVQAAADVHVGRGVHFSVAPGARVILGAGCAIGAGTRFVVASGEVRIGAGTRLGDRCLIRAGELIEVGAGVRAGDEVLLTDMSRASEDVERPVRAQGVRTAPVRVGARAILGPRSCVLPGCTVGEAAVLEPGSVADGDVAAGARVIGVPAAAPPPPTARRGRRRARDA